MSYTRLVVYSILVALESKGKPMLTVMNVSSYCIFVVSSLSLKIGEKMLVSDGHIVFNGLKPDKFIVVFLSRGFWACFLTESKPGNSF